MRRDKIFNDPVYGFISVPYGILFDLIEHPYFQRLRRIKQVSLTHYVYPGALHTRFHHALGAMYLMTQAIDVLRAKGTKITDEEATAARIAILLHDIGHGPFSHTLEHTLINVTHEDLSRLFMEQLNETFDGALDLAIEIFQDRHPKKFLHQLISGQLDMDRMDYLNRDSYFTGVYEGVIGYDRIIKMLDVHEDQLVVEEKGIYSIEKFLMARRLMYWQVYLHKTVLSAEQMLIATLRRAKDLSREGVHLPVPPSLQLFLQHEWTLVDFQQRREELLKHFARLDDYDIMSALKLFSEGPDPLLAYLSRSIVDRRLFRLELQNEPFDAEYKEAIRACILQRFEMPETSLPFLFLEGKERNSAYTTSEDEIRILFKDGRVCPISECSDAGIPSMITTKHYVAYPKECRVSGKET
ncbi:MAG: HD domain-containing protein [Saprospirales bacterium]|nr:HD domain-containing protein [Saprospirales bacterium]MBK8489620.1 HD domain-containing protein [Saprospirales bacterium]